MTDQERENLQKALDNTKSVLADLEAMVISQKAEVAKLDALLKE